MNDKETHINFWYFVAAILLLLMIQSWLIGGQTIETVSYSEFQRMLEENKIEEIAISEHHIRGKLKETPSDGRRHIYTVRVDPDFARDLKDYDVKFTGTVENNFVTTLLSWIVPALVFVGVWMFFIRNMAGRQGFGGLMSIGKSKAKVAVEKDIDVTFDDVAGVDEAKEELREIVQFLRDPKAYGRLGARVPKGVLLVGPPGTGKTLLARAVAGEAKVTFFSINGSEFVEMFVGVGAARVRDLFEQARKSAPCIIFIDEIDALGRARVAAPITGGADEKEQTLNQLLAELDGFDPSTGVVLLAATNRPEILDIALLRAGRFDRQILIDRPDKDGRAQILGVHMRKIVLADDVDAEKVALLTAGFSGADLANLVNEAAILATRRGGQAVNAEDFTRAIERIVAGLEKKSRVLSPNERKVVAYHEVGHALVTLALPGTETVHKVSIIPRGIGALGYNIQRPTEDRYLMTREELENKMASLMGGRAAEALVFGEISTGAQDDLEKVTEIGRGMVMRYGMDEALGQATYGRPRPLFLPDARFQPPETRNYSEQTASQIDEAVRHLVDRAFERATEVLRRNRDLLDRDAKLLLERETLSADEIGKPVGLDNLAAVAGAKPAE